MKAGDKWLRKVVRQKEVMVVGCRFGWMPGCLATVITRTQPWVVRKQYLCTASLGLKGWVDPAFILHWRNTVAVLRRRLYQ